MGFLHQRKTGDPWQKQGLGDIFTDYILEIAKERGIKNIYAEVLSDNSAMLHIFKKRGFELTLNDGIYHGELKL